MKKKGKTGRTFSNVFFRPFFFCANIIWHSGVLNDKTGNANAGFFLDIT
jgi:hypothetical protein